MRIAAILFIVVCFSFANAIVDLTDLYATEHDLEDGQLRQSISGVADDEYTGGNALGTSGDLSTSDFVFGFLEFTKIFVIGIAMPLTLLTTWGVPTNLAFLLTFPVYVVYLFAVIYMITGRFFE